MENAIIDRARSRLGARRYRLLRNNCEHFSEWCIVGEPRSVQVEKWLALPHTVTRGIVERARRTLRRVGTRCALPVLRALASNPANAA